MPRALIAALLLAVPGLAQSVDPPTHSFTIPGTTGLKWVDTGLDVKAGDLVRLSATGQVDVKADWGVVGPEGTTKFAPQPPGYYPLESKHRYGLAARIAPPKGKGKAQAWAYGDAQEMKATKDGRLWLTVNDDSPDDNTGAFQVKVVIVPGHPKP